MHRRWLWTAMLFVGCPAGQGEPIAAELLGYRALARRGAEPLTPEFDPAALPLLRLSEPGTSSTGWSVSLCTPATRTAAEVEALDREGVVLLRVRSLRGAPPLGGVHVELSRAGKVARAWSARWAEAPDELATLAPVRALRAQRRHAEAEEELKRRWPELTPRERLQGWVERARLADSAGRPEDAITAWQALAEEATAAGVPTEASRALRNAAYLSYYGRRFAEAERLLDRAAAIDGPIQHAAGALWTSHHRALIAQELGDYRAATRARRDALRTAGLLGLDREAAYQAKSLGSLLQDQGFHDEARAQLELAAALYYGARAAPEERASFANDLGWLLAAGMIQGAFARDYARPRALFEEAWSILRERGEPMRQANVVANLLWLAHHERDHRGAQRLLEEARRLDPEGRGRAALFTEMMAGELELAERRASAAERAFARVAARARAESGGGPSEYVWRAEYGAGRARAARGDAAEAQRHFAAALRELARLGERTDLREARALFFDDRRQLVDDALALMIDRGLHRDALALADASRTTTLRALEAEVRLARLSAGDRATWDHRLAMYLALRDEIARRRDDARLLVGEPLARARISLADLERRRAAAFDDAYAHLDRAAPLSPPAPRSLNLAHDEALFFPVRVGERVLSFLLRGPRLAHAWDEAGLSRWERSLGGARHLFVVGELPNVDELARLLPSMSISVLPWLGLLERPRAAPAGLPLVVADPGSNLPHARREGETARSLLGEATLLTGDMASRSRVLQALPGARVFHFAGHGVLDAVVPWDSRLELARGESLRLEDLLVDRPALGLVVLSGCETGRTGALGRRERLGLPEAFLASGARAVLATVRPVGDQEAQTFVERFYRAGGASDPVEAYRRAALEALREGDRSWEAFRVFGRR